jgi:Outer membrane lipoprotein-sorting protein
MNFPILRSEGTREISQPQSGWCPAPENFQVPQGRRNSIVLSGRNFLKTQFQPLCGWLISNRRSATQFMVAAPVLFFAVGATAGMTNDVSDAQIQGHDLAKQLCQAHPVESCNTSVFGVLNIRKMGGSHTNVTVEFETVGTETNWSSFYNADVDPTNQMLLIIGHRGLAPNDYSISKDKKIDSVIRATALKGNQTMVPFADSDFWVADLGLEFFHWPEQKILKHEMRRGRACKVLESVNPNPSAGYSRVVSWIDSESGGIVHAEAYDPEDKLLKEFDPKSFRKVNGQWELQDMEIRNVQTGSRTRLEFDLKAQSAGADAQPSPQK